MFQNPILKYLNRIVIALSIFINVIAGGKSNQTFSARNWDWKIKGYPNLVWVIDIIFWFDKNHCELAWEFWNTIKNYYPENEIFR